MVTTDPTTGITVRQTTDQIITIAPIHRENQAEDQTTMIAPIHREGQIIMTALIHRADQTITTTADRKTVVDLREKPDQTIITISRQVRAEVHRLLQVEHREVLRLLHPLRVEVHLQAAIAEALQLQAEEAVVVVLHRQALQVGEVVAVHLPQPHLQEEVQKAHHPLHREEVRVAAQTVQTILTQVEAADAKI